MIDIASLYDSEPVADCSCVGGVDSVSVGGIVGAALYAAGIPVAKSHASHTVVGLCPPDGEGKCVIDVCFAGGLFDYLSSSCHRTTQTR